MRNRRKSAKEFPKVLPKAFSLIEIAMAILIIGILIAAVVKSGSLIHKFKIATARSLTKSSPVASISGLVLWLETTTEGSFSDYSSLTNGVVIGSWRDVSQQKKTGYDATQTVSTLKPTFAEYSINSLPTLRFDGDDYLSFDNGRFLDGKTTTFIVLKYDANNPSYEQYVLSRYNASPDNNGGIIMRFTTSNTFENRIDDAASTYPTAADTITTKPFIVRAINDGVNAKLKINDNTEVVSSDTLAGYNFANSAMPAAIACRADNSSVCLTGNIGEIIVFNRLLNDDENDEIQKYLNKKWKIY